MQEKLQDRSPGESENKFIKAWDSGAKEEPWRQNQGVALDKLPLPFAPLSASLVGILRA